MQRISLRFIVILTALLAGITTVYAEPLSAVIKRSERNKFGYVSDQTFWHRTHGEQFVRASYPLDINHDLANIPLTLGSWMGQDVPTSNVNTLIVLQPEQFIERLYQNDRGEHIWLTLIGSRESRSFHPPIACYTSDGWIADVHSATVPISGGEINGMVVVAEKAEISAEHISFYFYVFPNESRISSDGIVLLRLTSPPYGTLEDTLAYQGEFLSHLLKGADVVVEQPETVLETPVLLGNLQLNAYQISHEQTVSGGVFAVELSWLPVAETTVSYHPVVSLIDETGLVWSNTYMQYPQGHEEPPISSEWPINNTMAQALEITTLRGTPPGQYEVVMSVIDNDGRQVPFVSSEGIHTGIDFSLGRLEIIPPSVAPKHKLDNRKITTLPSVNAELLEFSLAQSEVQSGDTLFATSFWKKAQRIWLPWRQSVSIELTDDMGQTIHTWNVDEFGKEYPIWRWNIHDEWRQQQQFRLPATIQSGSYHLSINDIVLTTIEVKEPFRHYQPPAEMQIVDASFENGIRLIGFVENLPELKLIWQTDHELDKNLHVFVHLTASNGEILAQSDGMPVNWTRPVRSWVADEFVIDTHTLQGLTSQPAGDLRLRIGLYDPETFERIPIASSDHVELMLSK